MHRNLVIVIKAFHTLLLLFMENESDILEEICSLKYRLLLYLSLLLNFAIERIGFNL